VQIIVEVEVEAGVYASEQYQSRINAPSVCPNCGMAQSLEAHGYYWRWVSEGSLRRGITNGGAPFLCRCCAVTVSCPPQIQVNCAGCAPSWQWSFQHFNLWLHLTALKNVIEAPVHVLGLSRAEAIERARRDLAKVGLSQEIEKMYSPSVGGQQQRVAIARALAMEPEVMLFDEPTSALDPELVGEVLKVMQKLASEGRTMVVVTHEMSFARNFSSHAILRYQGRIEEKGSPAEVFERPKSERLQQFLAVSLK
jgi:ABC-type polar amino acid transport system ATPase subunit